VQESEAREIIEKVKAGKIQTHSQLFLEKARVAEGGPVEPNSAVLQFASDDEKALLQDLVKRKVRTISGVAVVAVMTSPEKSCPWKCVYCPGGEDSQYKSPKSYTGLEPSARRGARLNFDSRAIVEDRLRQLDAIGHPTDKVEIIVMGGTFLSRHLDYQYSFIKGIYDGMNGIVAPDLAAARQMNETAGHRCVALTIETRPDVCGKLHIDRMLEFGTTRVELGVQNLSDEVYKLTKRGHLLKHVVEATARLKDAGLKVCYHVMPGLFQSAEQDLEDFKRLFSDSNFKPDMLKIYPTLVVAGTELYEMWQKGEFKPMSNIEASDMLARAKRFIPHWCRVMRIQRDIPATEIDAGVEASNLRELVARRAEELGIKCRCIRCREAGFVWLRNKVLPQNLEMVESWYRASGGREVFLSLEDLERDIIVGYLRLRFPSKPYRQEIDADTAIVRELKVVGSSLSIGQTPRFELQHRGFGRRLMQRAEDIARQEGMKKIVVTSAVGTRAYYKKLGYDRRGFYMSKDFI